jgi:response regulator RpfG family c-di-GMP phosphodiesterase
VTAKLDGTSTTTPFLQSPRVEAAADAASFAYPWLQRWFSASVITEEDWEGLSPNARRHILACKDYHTLVQVLLETHMLTPYQGERLLHGQEFGLILGNYRVLEILGSGGMGVVYRGEHACLRHPVAIKTLHPSLSRSPSRQELSRFYTEARAIAQLTHPHIVRALDVGMMTPGDPQQTPIHYFVMEFVEGQNLEDFVNQRGPLAMGDACEFAHQVASALAEAHKFGIVHRDIKPSNILITQKGQTKLLDFGLMRNFRNRLTEPGTVLGTIDYMSPEQARDASVVDLRSDIYSLGATLYWMVTGRLPFKQLANVAQELAARQMQVAPSIRLLRPDLPPDLDKVLQRMMALRPEDRYQSAPEVMKALLKFLRQESYEQQVLPSLADFALPPVGMPQAGSQPQAAAGLKEVPRPHRVLIVDDNEAIHSVIALALQPAGIHCDSALNGPKALSAFQTKTFDLVLLDVNLPGGMSGLEVCRRLRTCTPTPRLKIIMISGQNSDELSQSLAAGADDYLNKPFTPVQLLARVKAALRFKYAQDKTDLLNRHLMAINTEMEQTLHQRQNDLLHIRQALVKSLQKVLVQSGVMSREQQRRLQRYARLLAEHAASQSPYKEVIDNSFIEQLETCIPLCDIGVIGLPDEILFKPGKYTDNERLIMQTHTVVGAEMLKEVAEEHRSAAGFLLMAAEIARSHHERWDGGGYPDGLVGEKIPLTARITAILTSYDALRSRRIYKPSLGHEAALHLMNAEQGQFDPNLLAIFRREAKTFEKIFQELA